MEAWSADAIHAGMSAERSFANSSGPIVDAILATAAGVVLSLPRYQRAASARPAGSPANWSRPTVGGVDHPDRPTKCDCSMPLGHGIDFDGYYPFRRRAASEVGPVRT